MLQRGIALAFLPPDVEEGAEVAVDIRGSRAPGPGGAHPVLQAGLTRRPECDIPENPG